MNETLEKGTAFLDKLIELIERVGLAGLNSLLIGLVTIWLAPSVFKLVRELYQMKLDHGHRMAKLSEKREKRRMGRKRDESVS